MGIFDGFKRKKNDAGYNESSRDSRDETSNSRR